MRRTVRPDGRKGRITVNIGPELGYEQKCVIDINDHFDADEPDNVLGAKEILCILNEIWEEAMERADKYIKDFMLMAAKFDQQAQQSK